MFVGSTTYSQSFLFTIGHPSIEASSNALSIEDVIWYRDLLETTKLVQRGLVPFTTTPVHDEHNAVNGSGQASGFSS